MVGPRRYPAGRIVPAGVDGWILAKLEYLNPGFSRKDRIALQIIEDAEAIQTARRPA